MIKLKLSSGRRPFYEDGTLRNSPGQAYLINNLNVLVPHPREERLGEEAFALAILEMFDLVSDNVLYAVTDEIVDRALDGCRYRPRLEQIEEMIETAVEMNMVLRQVRLDMPEREPVKPPRPTLLPRYQRGKARGEPPASS
jgi:hypothetical protein